VRGSYTTAWEVEEVPKKPHSWNSEAKAGRKRLLPLYLSSLDKRPTLEASQFHGTVEIHADGPLPKAFQIYATDHHLAWPVCNRFMYTVIYLLSHARPKLREYQSEVWVTSYLYFPF
jgi:hypothetical protein